MHYFPMMLDIDFYSGHLNFRLLLESKNRVK